MRRWMLMALLVLLCCGYASAEEAAERIWGQLPSGEWAQLDEISGVSVEQMARQLLAGEMPDLSQWPEQLRAALTQALARQGLRAVGILACACACELTRTLAGQHRKTVHRALDLLCEMAAGLTLLALTVELIDSVSHVCNRLKAFSNAAAPVLVAALTLVGAPSMAAAMTPSAAAADGISVFLSADVGLPLIRIASILAVCGGLSDHFRLNRLFKLCVSAIKWLLGACMTGFLALMSVKSVALGGHDSVAVQTVSFAVDNLLPIIGSEVADTVGSVLASAALVKNAAGLAVCAALIAMVALPVTQLVAAALTMRLLSACLELIDSGSLAELTDRFSQVIESLLAILAAVAALGVILAGAVVFTAGARA